MRTTPDDVAALQQPTDRPDLLTVAEVCRRLDLSPATLLRHVRAGQVPHVRIGRRVLFHPGVLDEWVVERARASVRAVEPPTASVVRRARRVVQPVVSARRGGDAA